MAGIDPRTRGSIVHRALEDLDFDAPAGARAETSSAPSPTTRRRRSPTPSSRTIQAFVQAFARLTAVRAPHPAPARVTREAVVRLRARARRLRPARARHRRRLRHESRRHAPGRRLQDRPRPRGHDPAATTSPATTRRSGSSTRSRRCAPARPRVEVAYCLLERPDEPVTTTSHRRTTRPTSPTRSPRSPTASSPTSYAVTPTPHRELCGDCPGRHALCSHPQSDDAQASAGSLAGSTGPSYVSGRCSARRRSTTALSSAPKSSATFVTHSHTSRITAPANAP